MPVLPVRQGDASAAPRCLCPACYADALAASDSPGATRDHSTY